MVVRCVVEQYEKPFFGPYRELRLPIDETQKDGASEKTGDEGKMEAFEDNKAFLETMGKAMSGMFATAGDGAGAGAGAGSGPSKALTKSQKKREKRKAAKKRQQQAAQGAPALEQGAKKTLSGAPPITDVPEEERGISAEAQAMLDELTDLIDEAEPGPTTKHGVPAKSALKGNGRSHEEKSKKKVELLEDVVVLDESKRAHEREAPLEAPVVEYPPVDIVHESHVDMQDFRMTKEVASHVPSHLRLSIVMEHCVEPGKELDVDVEPRMVIIRTLKPIVYEKRRRKRQVLYELDIPLAYEVLPGDSTAEWDASKKTLQLRLKVLEVVPQMELDGLVPATASERAAQEVQHHETGDDDAHAEYGGHVETEATTAAASEVEGDAEQAKDAAAQPGETPQGVASSTPSDDALCPSTGAGCAPWTLGEPLDDGTTKYVPNVHYRDRMSLCTFTVFADVDATVTIIPESIYMHIEETTVTIHFRTSTGILAGLALRLGGRVHPTKTIVRDRTVGMKKLIFSLQKVESVPWDPVLLPDVNKESSAPAVGPHHDGTMNASAVKQGATAPSTATVADDRDMSSIPENDVVSASVPAATAVAIDDHTPEGADTDKTPSPPVSTSPSAPSSPPPPPRPAGKEGPATTKRAVYAPFVRLTNRYIFELAKDTSGT